jgi:hypothetical protein
MSQQTCFTELALEDNKRDKDIIPIFFFAKNTMHTILPAALEIPKWIFHVIALNHNEIRGGILGVGFRIIEKTSKSYICFIP